MDQKDLMKTLNNPYVRQLEESEFLDDTDLVSTPIYALNIALSGDVHGGFGSGVITLAGKSKSFKTLFALSMARGYLSKYPDAQLIFFDSEFGSPKSYFSSFGKDKDRIIHAPILTIEDLRSQLMNLLDKIERGDKVIIIVDSVGNLASLKETEDALDNKQSVDMTRAKILKSLFRLVTPRLTLKDIPMIVINHTYQTLEMFSKEVMGGGTGNVYASDNIFFIGKQQEKEGKDFVGYNFIINIEKSRYVREKEKLPVKVLYGSGIDRFSGIFDLAVEFGVIQSPSKGWYEYQERKMRRKEIESDKELMQSIVDDPEFQKAVSKRFKLFQEE